MSTTIGDRIKASRREQFVGRTEELNLFQRALVGKEPNLLLLHVHGPAGVGKTTLLREYQRLAGGHGPLWLDGKAITPTTSGFVEAFDKVCDRATGRTVVLIDEYDDLSPLDAWFRDAFIPDLPEDALVVLAGRRPLGNRWVCDPAWQQLSRSLSLRNLDEVEQRAFLDSRGVPTDQQVGVMEFTRGHPLALSLVTANLAQNTGVEFDAQAFPDVIRMLLERFMDNVPSPLHRSALEASCLVRVTTEAILAQVIDPAKSFELFEWMRGLTFMESGPEGISPTELAREAIAYDLRWRNPELNAVLHERSRKFYADNLERTRGQANQATVRDYIYLHRDNPTVKPFFSWGFGGAYLDGYRPADRSELLKIATEHEGAESSAILEHWLEVQPENVVVLRGSGETPTIDGFLLKLALEGMSGKDLAIDPGAKAAHRHLAEKAPLRKGEVATLFRYWMDREAHQGVSPSQSLIFVAIVQHSLMQPHLAHTFIPCVNPEFWLPMFSYAALVRLEESDFQVGSKQYGMYGHDWRVLSPRAWLDLLSERELALNAPLSAAPRAPDIVLLSRESFNEAVQEAAKSFNDASKLLSNPLLRSRLVTSQLSTDSRPADRVEAIRSLIRAQAESWRVSGREAKLYDALEHGYIRPASTQERSAELLDISIATFRRHLSAAVAKLSEGLWEVEINGCS